jgi:hypothetical protein
MARLSIAALLVAAACQRQPARIYTDKEIAELEARVMAKVAETDASCSKPELAAFVDSPSEECKKACREVDSTLRAFTSMLDDNVDTIEMGRVDELCGADVLAAFGAASVGSPSCSPYQVGVRAEKELSAVDPMHQMHIFVRHALRETDPYVALTELLLGIRVYQDHARGRINLIHWMVATSMEGTLVAAMERVLSRSSLSAEQLADLAATLDAVIESEPSTADALQGEAIYTSLHYGLAGLKPPDWQPPGGRSDSTISKDGPFRITNHDRRDDAAHTMTYGLHMANVYAKACPVGASLAQCHANLPPDSAAYNADLDATDKHAARVAMFPDDETRRDSQRQLLEQSMQFSFVDSFVQRRARLVTSLVGLRVRAEVLRNGVCPASGELAMPAWRNLLAPAVLGDSVRITRAGAALVVDPPAWAVEKPPINRGPPFPPPIKRPKPEPVSIPCP